jgi:hypothetical protein
VNQAEEFFLRFCRFFFEILQPEKRPRFWLQNIRQKLKVDEYPRFSMVTRATMEVWRKKS